MEKSNISPQDVIFALDIGTRSVIGTVGVVRDKKFYVINESYIEHEERAMIDGQIHDITEVANTVSKIKKTLEKKLNLKLESVCIAAAGRFLKTIITKSELKIDYNKEIDKDTIRSLELTAVKKAEEANKENESELYCVGYSVKNYFLNGYVISNLLSHKGENIGVEVIATFLPSSVIDSLYSVMDKVGLNISNLTLEPIAAMEAVIPKNLRLLNLALVDIGAGTSDIAISNKDTISAYGMVPLAGDEITEIIAKNYLVDFNMAEKMKKECSIKEKVSYIDVLGMENEVNSEEIKNIINSVVEKVAEKIGDKVIELNGEKSPSAVFLVGGGAHTPNIKEKLAEKLNLPIQRLGIKERAGIIECICKDNSLGSIGVTVLGIALISIKRLGNDFIDVILNGNVISLFNSHIHTVMDVILQGGINPKILLSKNGKNVKFILNGIKRVAFGSLATNAQIKINGIQSSIDSKVKEGDNIDIIFAKDGKDAKPKVMDYIQKLDSITFYLNDIIYSLEPIGIINNEVVDIKKEVKEGDNVEIVFPKTLGELVKFNFNKDNNEEFSYYLNGQELSDNYAIKDGDRIYKVKKKQINNEAEDNNLYEDYNKEVAISDIKDEKSVEHNQDNNEIIDKDFIEVVVNKENVILKGKKNYTFVDVFNYVEFDLSVPKGNLILLLNGSKAGYYDKLSNGDVIDIKWSN